MAKLTYNVCVVVVTYADRWQFLERVLRSVLLLRPLSKVIVVDNASSYNVKRACDELKDSRVEVLCQQKNRGSAGGYKAGLTHINQSRFEGFVWLLDDDNLPQSMALDHLTSVWKQYNCNPDADALLSYRADKPLYVRVAQGQNSGRYFLVENSFLGFHAGRVLSNKYKKLKDRLIKPQALNEISLLPYAPYGGLFFHTELLKTIGYPDERLFVYADDTEYTYRITQAGGSIYQVTASRIKDIDPSQGTGYKGGLLSSPTLDLWNFRTYYQVRNGVYFSSRNAVTNSTIFALNKYLYLAGHKVISIFSSKGRNYKKLVKAVNDGLSGRLGQADPSNI